MPRNTLYGKDLARIHVDGYGFHWEQAALTILGFLKQHGITGGTVVDLGCGGGQWLERLADNGYSAYGIDISMAMIRDARKRVPGGRFIRGCFSEVELPDCVAVTSLGEPINYLDTARKIKRVFGHVYQALQPGGIFVFDAREATDTVLPPRVTARSGDTWACFATIHEHGPSNTLTRDITTFRKVGRGYRRDHEVHRLKIYPRSTLLKWLRAAGFRVRRYSAYGDYRLGPRQSVFVARKAV